MTFLLQCQCQDIPNLELLLRPHQLLRYMCGVADEKVAAYSDCSYKILPQQIDRAFRKCFDFLYGPSSSESTFTMRRVFCSSRTSYWSQERALTSCLNSDQSFTDAIASPPSLSEMISLQSCLKLLTN